MQQSQHGPAEPQDGLTPAQKARSRRTKRRYTVIAVILVIAIAAVIAGVAWLVLSDNPSASGGQSQNATALVDQAASTGETSAAQAPTAVTEVPDLASLVGTTADDAVAALGNQAHASGDSDVAEEGSDIVALRRVTIGTTAAGASDDGGTSHAAADPAVSLSLDANGVVLVAYYTVDLAQLGVPYEPFEDQLGDAQALASFLSDAGIPVEADALAAPDGSQVVTESDANGNVSKESYTFEGDAPDASGASRHWELGISYDHSLENVSGSASDLTRTLSIRVS